MAERTPEEERAAVAAAMREVVAVVMAQSLDGGEGCKRVLHSSTIPPGELLFALASLGSLFAVRVAQLEGTTVGELIARVGAGIEQSYGTHRNDNESG